MTSCVDKNKTTCPLRRTGRITSTLVCDPIIAGQTAPASRYLVSSEGAALRKHDNARIEHPRNFPAIVEVTHEIAPLSTSEPLDERAGLVRQYREPLIRYFTRKRIPRDSVEDCAQEVFLRLARTNEDMVRNAEAYLFTIASSVVVSFARKAKTHREAHHHPIEDFSLVSGEAAPDRVL